MKQQVMDENDTSKESKVFEVKTFYSGIIYKHCKITTQEQKKEHNLDIGEYDIINASELFELGQIMFEKVEHTLCKIFKQKLKRLNINDDSKVFIVGLGNAQLSSDSLGSLVVSKVLITGDIKDKKHLMSTFALTPNILAKTGIETFDIVKILTDKIKPDLVIIVDSLATNCLQRLGVSFQFSPTIIAGGAFCDTNKKFSKESLKTNCICIGVPLVYVETQKSEKIFLTPKDIEIKVNICAKIIANMLNKSLQTKISSKEIQFLMQ